MGKKVSLLCFKGQVSEESFVLELENYIRSTKKPLFKSFVDQNAQRIVHWSLDKDRDTSELFSLWKKRFALTYKELGKIPSADTLSVLQTALTAVTDSVSL